MNVLQFYKETNISQNNLNPSLKCRIHSIGHLVNKIHPDVKAHISTCACSTATTCVCVIMHITCAVLPSLVLSH